MATPSELELMRLLQSGAETVRDLTNQLKEVTVIVSNQERRISMLEREQRAMNAFIKGEEP